MPPMAIINQKEETDEGEGAAMAALAAQSERSAPGAEPRAFDPWGRDGPTLLQLPVELIMLDLNQPRQELGDLTDLEDSIREHGIIQPLIVSPLDERRYQLIAGERRLTAAKAARLARVPAVVRTVAEHHRLELQLVENLHRKDLDAVEEATAYQRLMGEFGLSQQELARRLGKSPAVINETLRVLDLAPRILKELRAAGHAPVTRSLLLEIAKQPADEQLPLWREAKTGRLTVKEARARKTKKERSGLPRCTIELDSARVTLLFRGASATPGQIIRTLEEALTRYRAEHPRAAAESAAHRNSCGEAFPQAPAAPRETVE
jgi:ParB family chromosome partitioning protein